jgi:malonyl CoA-acyl carrier protein transacylase
MATAPTMTEDIAAADKEMEERANRAKDLLSQRYLGLRSQQVRDLVEATTNQSRICLVHVMINLNGCCVIGGSSLS